LGVSARCGSQTGGDPVTGDCALRALDVLVGTWDLSARWPPERGGPAEFGGQTSFEWILGGAFLAQTSEIGHPQAPGAYSLYGPRAEGQGYLQHYFDSRGIARVLEMTLENNIWTLERTKPDFTPLPFRQRFIGEIAADGDSIEGRFELAEGDEDYRLDFEMSHTRIA
jgi:hypothetical protein